MEQEVPAVSCTLASQGQESNEKIHSVPSCSIVGRGQEGVGNSGWKVCV